MTDLILPSGAKDQKAVRDAMIEIGNSLTMIDAQKDQIKDILEVVKEKYELPPADVRKVATAMHKMNVEKVQGKQDDFDALFEMVTKSFGSAEDEG